MDYNMRRWMTLCEAKISREMIDALKPHLRPAVKVNGKLHVGKRGQPHDFIINAHYPYQGQWVSDEYDEKGFYDLRTKTWYSSEDLGNLDSTDLMTRSQRIRTFGNESVERTDRKSLFWL